MTNRWRAFIQRLFHRHRHEMQFPDGNLNWIFVCKCGDTTTDIRKANP
jgi:hypothetical protein